LQGCAGFAGNGASVKDALGLRTVGKIEMHVIKLHTSIRCETATRLID
jgi:hypothetical protein